MNGVPQIEWGDGGLTLSQNVQSSFPYFHKRAGRASARVSIFRKGGFKKWGLDGKVKEDKRQKIQLHSAKSLPFFGWSSPKEAFGLESSNALLPDFVDFFPPPHQAKVTHQTA